MQMSLLRNMDWFFTGSTVSPNLIPPIGFFHTNILFYISCMCVNIWEKEGWAIVEKELEWEVAEVHPSFILDSQVVLWSGHAVHMGGEMGPGRSISPVMSMSPGSFEGKVKNKKDVCILKFIKLGNRNYISPLYLVWLCFSSKSFSSVSESPHLHLRISTFRFMLKCSNSIVYVY